MLSSLFYSPINDFQVFSPAVFRTLTLSFDIFYRFCKFRSSNTIHGSDRGIPKPFEIFSNKHFSEEFIREFIDKLNIDVVFEDDYMSPFLSDKFFEDFSEDYEYWREYF